MENDPFPTSSYDAVQLLTMQTKLAELRSGLSKKHELLKNCCKNAKKLPEINREAFYFETICGCI